MASAGSSEMMIKIWGARGGIPVSGKQYQEFGGDTPCVEVQAAGRHVIFDLGSGAVPLGRQLMGAGVSELDVFFTHTHYDHIIGLPFFVPLFNPNANIRMRAGHLMPENTLDGVVSQLMASPLFPVPKEIFPSNVTYEDFTSGDSFDLGDGIAVRTVPLNHPDRATGYRVDFAGTSFVLLTDLEHTSDTPDPALVEIAQGADLVVYDASYTEEEYPARKGFGHSTWEQAVKLADTANVGQLVLFHNDPMHDDAAMRAIEADAAAARPGTVAARQGMEFVLGEN